MRCELISYPKSGRSRIRFGLHHVGRDQEIRFHHDGFEFNDGARPAHDFSVEKRLERLASVERVVFLKRDPRDLLVSLFHQVTGRFQDFFHYQGTISDFIRDPYFGAEVLRRFYDMWDQIGARREVLVVHYENCMENPSAAFDKIGRHFGIELSSEVWREAAEASSFENMKRVEVSGEFPKPWLKLRNGHSKVRRGKVGGYTDSLPPDDITYLNSVFGLEDSPVSSFTTDQH